MTSNVNSPLLYRRWTAIATLAAAMQRNTWVFTMGDVLYPNLYVILTGPPGVGKSKILSWSRKLIKGIGESHHIAHSSLTSASLVDNLDNATRRHIRPNEVPASFSFNSLYIASSELGVLLPTYDTAFMNQLQDLYDCTPFSQMRRTRSLMIDIPRPQLNILAACTPAYLQGTLPEGAWAEGFTSRCIFIFSAEQVVSSLFAITTDDLLKFESLMTRLDVIGDVYGQFTFTEEAAQFMDNWHLGGQEPVPDHPKLFNYVTRRTANVLKLSMIASISENLNLVIEKQHVMRALDWLIEAEHYMPDIFKSMANTSHSQILQDTWHYVFDTYRKENKRPVAHARVINFISQRVPAYSVERVLEILIGAGYLRAQMTSGRPEYIPRGKEK